MDTISEHHNSILSSSSRDISRNHSQSVLHKKKSRNVDSGIFTTQQLSTQLPPSSYRGKAFNSQSQPSLLTPQTFSKAVSPSNVNNVNFNISINKEFPYILNQQPNYTFNKHLEKDTQSNEEEKSSIQQEMNFSFDPRQPPKDPKKSSLDSAYKRQGLTKNNVSLPQLDKY